MGYLEENHQFLQVAINCLKNGKGIIHYHEVCPDELIPFRPLKNVRDEVESLNKGAELLSCKHVKSYAPGVSHIVLDLEIT